MTNTDPATSPANPDATAVPAEITTLLRDVRTHLDMDVAYLSQFDGEQAVFRAVDAPGFAGVSPGFTIDIKEVYCNHILSGDLPRLIPDTSAHQICRDLPITQHIPIGSHVSVPLHAPDGSVYGMFCCLGQKAKPALTDAHLDFMEDHARRAADILFSLRKQTAPAAPTAA